MWMIPGKLGRARLQFLWPMTPKLIMHLLCISIASYGETIRTQFWIPKTIQDTQKEREASGQRSGQNTPTVWSLQILHLKTMSNIRYASSYATALLILNNHFRQQLVTESLSHISSCRFRIYFRHNYVIMDHNCVSNCFTICIAGVHCLDDTIERVIGYKSNIFKQI
jgi:hypothetical protein